ncbi:MAG TPA: VOC family protein [Candidatus Dormibacteraeota bacterium]
MPRSKPSTAKRKPLDPIAQIGWIQTDCHDPERLAAFWGAVLGVEVEDRFGDPPQYVNLGPATPDAPRVCFQRVPEAKVTKNRVHLDVAVQDVDVAASRITALGGRRLPHDDYHEDGYSWRIMADPEGNEFCLIYGQYQPGPSW